MDSPRWIDNYAAVEEAFGHWPVFHDAGVLALAMDRESILFGSVCNARVRLHLHAFEWLAAGPGCHHRVRFEFDDVRDVELRDFNYQNAIYSLIFTRVQDAGPDRPGAGVVEIAGALGLSGRFAFERGRVVEVVPCGPKASLLL